MTETTAEAGNRRLDALKSQLGAGLGLLILVGALSIANPRFATTANFSSILKTASFVGIAAAGETLVILTAGIDLSVGSVVAFSGVIAAGLMTGFAGGPLLSPLAAIIVGVAAGGAVGACNGALVSYLRMPPFIVTLAAMLIVRGLATVYTSGKTIYGLPHGSDWLSGDVHLPGGFDFPVAGLFMLLAFAVLAVITARTVFGRNIYAIGGSEEAARLSGVRVARTKLAVYCICGLLSGLAGVLLVFRLGCGIWNAGDMYELDAIAACVIGGTSLNGGVGTVGGTLIGVLIMGCVRSGLTILNISPYWQKVIIGLIILIAVGIDMLRKRRR